MVKKPVLSDAFFDRDPCVVAVDLLGKVIRRKYEGLWLAASIVETEAYYIREKGSHASLGRTKSREPLFAPPGTIYMYYARGGDSLNVSCRGDGNAVLIKAAHPFVDRRSPLKARERMLELNPLGGLPRRLDRLCAGQTLLCRALALSVPDWTGRRFSRREFFIDDVDYHPSTVIQTRRLGIPAGRDEHLLLRFIDHERANASTRNPLRQKTLFAGVDYLINTRENMHPIDVFRDKAATV